MNAERLLQLYGRVSEAPDAIPRLRKFILDLAVRGKLCEQDPDDEPASKLIERVFVEKASDRKRRKPLPEIDTTAFENVPNGWCIVPLIALGTWAIGSGFPKNEQGRSEGPYFFLKVSDMNLPGNEKHIITANNRIDDDAVIRMRVAIHPPGTIIFPKIGGAIATNKRRILTRASAIDNNCLGITFSPQLDLAWAYLLLTTMDFTKHQAGTAVPALQQSVLEKIPVALPPLLDQQRIVAKVDELMALLDRLEMEHAQRETVRDKLTTASFSRLTASDIDAEDFKAHAEFAIKALPELTTRPDQIKLVRRAILDLAVRGKLVEQDLNDEPASELIIRISCERDRLIRSRKIKGGIVESIGPTDFPFEVPAIWYWTRLGGIGDWGSGSTPSRGSLELYGGGLTWLKSGELNDNTQLAGSEETVTEAAIASGSFRINRPGDVLIAMYGATIGKLAILAETAVTNQAVCGCTPFAGVSSSFLFLFLLSQRDAFRRASEGGAQPNISKAKIVNTPFPLPPLAEQHRIVARVDELMSICDGLERGLIVGQSIEEGLLETLLVGALEQATVQAV